MTKTKEQQLLSCDEATITARQHRSPCGDCPFARTSLAGWLGDLSIGWWIHVAHSEGFVECHTRIRPDGGAHQCAGIAIYRRNTCKSVSAPNLTLPMDNEKVFANSVEFASHHSKGKLNTSKKVLKEHQRALNSIVEAIGNERKR